MKGFWGRTKQRLTQKLGPAPVWLWLILALGGVYWYMHRASAAAATPASTTAADTGSTTAASPDYSGLGGVGGGGASVQPQPDTSSSPVSWDPAQFEKDVIDALTSAVADTTAPAPADMTQTVRSPAPPAIHSSAPPTIHSSAPPVTASSPPVSATTGLQNPFDLLIGTSRTGAKIFSTPTGAIVEQAPGKSAYQVAAAGSQAAGNILLRSTSPSRPLAQTVTLPSNDTKPRSSAAAAPSRTAPAPAKPAAAPTRKPAAAAAPAPVVSRGSRARPV